MVAFVSFDLVHNVSWYLCNPNSLLPEFFSLGLGRVFSMGPETEGTDPGKGSEETKVSTESESVDTSRRSNTNS